MTDETRLILNLIWQMALGMALAWLLFEVAGVVADYIAG
jgi:hypothetical protein